MNINDRLSAANSFKDLFDIAAKSTPQISFFGSKSISVNGYTGVLNLDDLAASTMKTIEKNFNFTEEERAIGEVLAKRIDKIYEESDELVKMSNIFTRIIHAFRKFINDLCDCGYNTRFYWDCERSNFKFYTKEQYQNVFNKLPKSEPHRIQTGCPPRWYSPEVMA
jgi:hypothetical protein